jgi:hypothetical protein
MSETVTNMIRTVVIAPSTGRRESHSSVLPERFSSQSQPQAVPIAGHGLGSVSEGAPVRDTMTGAPGGMRG